MTWSSIDLGSITQERREPPRPLTWTPAELELYVPQDDPPVEEPPAPEEPPPPPEPPAPSPEEVIQALVERHEEELKEAYERGRAAGIEEGRREEAAKLADAVLAAERAVDALREAEAQRAEVMEKNLVALAIAVAQHLIGRELESGRDIVAELVRRALSHFPLNQPVRIRINPQDLALISAARPDGQGPVPIAPGREVRWLPDPAVRRGGCLVEGQDRIVDGRVDLALERAYWALING